MEMPLSDFDRLAKLAGEARCATGDERARIVRRIEAMAKAFVFRERLLCLRWPPLGPEDFCKK